jgi:flagellar basal body-associated protein FliL
MLSISILGIVLVAMMLIVVGGIGFALGSAFTAKQRNYVDQPTNSPPLERDPSNPYAPTSVGGRQTSSFAGCAIAIAFLFFVGISLLIVVLATYFVSASSTPQTAPRPPAPVPATQPVLQPQSPPTSSS